MAKKIQPAPQVLTLEEARKLLRLGRNAAYQGIATGEIPSIRIGRRILVPRVALDRLLNIGVASDKAA